MVKAKSPKVKGSYKSPNTKEAIRSPKVKDVSKSPKSKEIVKSPNVKGTVKSPKVKEVIKSPKIKEVVKSPKIKEVIRSLKQNEPSSLKKKSPKTKKSWKGEVSSGQETPTAYLGEDQMKRGLKALMKYLIAKDSVRDDKSKPKDLLDAGLKPVLVEIVFKNIPSNSKTYIHNIQMPHHWRASLEPEDYNTVLFVKHRKPQNEAEGIQFERDRELDIENTHSYYRSILEEKLSERNMARISRIITSKELATEYNTHQKIDKLAKTNELFIGDKRLVSNKFNASLRRLGRRFWVRERKVPLSLKLDAPNLDERFEKLWSTEPFYVIGNSSTERFQIGVTSQKIGELVENMQRFLEKLHQLYGQNVRFIRIRSEKGASLPLFADLSTECLKEVKMQKKSVKRKAVEDDFDLVPNSKIRVNASGTVRVIKNIETT